MFDIRVGEERLDHDPAASAGHQQFETIGRVSSPWIERAVCPKNMREARERGVAATIEVDAPYRRGLLGLPAPSTIIVLTWLHQAPRDLIVQKPRHAPEPRGTFALRSPARPNPIGLHVARLLAVDAETGVLTLDAIDVLDGTPVLDIKPYFQSTDLDPALTTAG